MAVLPSSEVYNSLFDLDEESIRDERTMTDLHLGSAINLDQVEYLLEGKFDEYQIFIPRFQSRLWKKTISKTNNFKKKIIGLLEPTQNLLMKSSPKAAIRQTVYQDLISIIGKSLEARNVKIPLAESWMELSKRDILVDSINVEAFRFTLKLACMVSEASRGGKQSFYQGMIIDDECVVTKYLHGEQNLRICANNAFCVIDDLIERKSYYGSFDSLLLMMDTFGQRVCLEIGCQVARIGKMIGVPDQEVLEEILKVGDLMLKRYGNDGYEFIALFESMVVATILKKNPDKITDSNEFFHNCRGELQEMVVEGLYVESVMDLFDRLCSFLIHLSNESLSNIFCIYRIWGHPRVNIKEGMRKVMNKGLEEKMSSASISRIVLCQFRKMFLIEFYNRHHTYPPCTFSDSSYLTSCIQNQLPINSDSSKYSILDFEGIEIQKIWELPETYDACHILNDKAVSPNRSELRKSIVEGNGTMMGTQRRGIIRWMSSDSSRCKEFLNQIDDAGLDDDSLIIGMYEKEREIKIKARMFSLMSEKMRMYFVLTEEMISEKMLRYFPQITMKDPLHIQIKKLWNISGISNPDCLDPVINVDFEKWNLNMRDEFTLLLFKQMDKLYGYNNLISRTHEIFSNSYIYSSSGKYLPGVTNDGLKIDPPMAYIGHKGGFEGLRQKGWTIATVCLLVYIADSLKIKINLLGQGDNQVIRIYMPHSYWENLRLSHEQRIEEAKTILSEYVMSMNNHFIEAGLPIKLRESWKSTRLYMYGKNMFLDGNSLPQWTKKLLRSYALSNEGTLTISGVIGTIATNMCAAAHASEKPDVMYALYLLLAEWSLDYLFAYHPFTRKSIKGGDQIRFYIASENGKMSYNSGRISRDFLKAVILLIPTSVGGSISIPLLGYIIRGFPDNATEGYTWLKLLMEVKSKYRDLFVNWYSFLCNETREFDMLIQSPWSINHKKPPTPGLHSREIIRDWILSGKFKNNSFLNNTKKVMQGFDRKKICSLLIGKNVNPLILNEIYGSFPHVYLDQILRRVENTRTIKKMAFSMSISGRIIFRLMESEHEFLGYLFWRCFQRGKIFSKCATNHCRSARNVGWGVTIKGLTTPHPMEFLFDKVCDNYTGECPNGDYIYVRRAENGDFPPYLGSNVKTKVVSLQDIAIRSEPLVATAAKLLRFSDWLNLGPNSMKVIKENISVVCQTDVFQSMGDEVESFYSGCVEHRFNPSSASEGCFINYAPQVGKNVFMSSDCMPRYGRGETNYTLHFQAMYCMLQYVSGNRVGTNFQHYHLKCEDCIVPVDDEVDDIKDFSTVIERMYTDESKNLMRETLGYLNVRVDTFQDLIEEQVRSISVVSQEEHDVQRIGNGIHMILSCSCATMIMFSPRDIPNMVGADDLQAFPRIFAYKVSARRIMELTADMLLVIKASRMAQELNDIRDFSLIREKLLNQLLKVPLEKFKGLGSLMVGRTWDQSIGESSLTLNLGNYPEDPSSFLNATRAEIIDIIGKRTRIRVDKSKSQLPIYGSSDKVIRICIASKVLSSYDCQTCARNVVNWIRSEEDLLDCPFKHIEKIKRRNPGVAIPLDLAVKMLGVLPRTEPPEEIRELLDADIILMKKLLIPEGNLWYERLDVEFLEESVRFLKSKEQMLLPTSSIYKWDHVISFLDGHHYDNVLVFGDGTGYTSLALARRFINSKIMPTTLLEKKRLIPQDLSSLRPFASRRYSNVYGALLEEVPDDVFDDQWIICFKEFIKKLKGSILIVSDFEDKSGNIGLVKRLHQSIDEINQRIIHIHKIYLNEWEWKEMKDHIYFSPFSNLHYTECFMSSVSLGGMEENISEILDNDHVESWLDNENIELSICSREMNYYEVLETSLKIARAAFRRNLLPLKEEEMELPACAILYKSLLYISGNFKPAGFLKSSDDRRGMLDGILIGLIKGMKMLLIVLYGREIMYHHYFRFLHLADNDRTLRFRYIRNLQFALLEGTEEHKLTKKEYSAAIIMRQQWKKKHLNLLVPESPTTLTSLYVDEIIPGKEVYKNLCPL